MSRIDKRELKQVALIGAGVISERHLAAWRKLEEIEIVAIAEPNEARARERADQFGIPTVYPDLDALLASEQVDAIDITTPRATHTRLVRRAAGHDIAILCEKPLATNLSDARELAADVADKARVMVHENWRFRPTYRHIQRWVAECDPGRFVEGHAAFRSGMLFTDPHGLSRLLDQYPIFRTEKRLLIAEMLIHPIDAMRWLVGPLNLVAARALRTVDAIPGETCATLLFDTKDGAPLTVTGNIAMPEAPSSPDDVRLVFERGTVGLSAGCLEFRGAGSETIEFDFERDLQASFEATLAHFANAVRSGTPFETSVADNLETLRLVEEAYAEINSTTTFATTSS